MRYFMLHKPRGCISSTVDDTGRGRPTVYDVARAAGIPNFGPVGRLDFDTSGVLLFTDDYKLKKAISSPTYKGKAAVGSVASMEKVYHLLIAGTIKPDDKGMQLLREPLHFNRKKDGPGGVWTKPAEARVLLTKTFQPGQPVPWRFKPGVPATITWIEVVLREGKNREIRRLCGRSEFELTRLHRVSVGPIVLGDVEESSCRELSRKEVEALYKRCLPEDPLCPTVKAVKNTLETRLAHTALRARRPAGLKGSPSERSTTSPRGTVTIAPIEKPVVGAGDTPTPTKGGDRRASGGEDEEEDDLGRRRARTAGGGAATEAFGSAGDLAGVVELVIDFARRDLHEAPPGAAGESAGEDYCPGEEESLAQARAVRPNEAHMV
eukprot:g13484.t1